MDWPRLTSIAGPAVRPLLAYLYARLRGSLMSGLDWLYVGLILTVWLAALWRLLAEPADASDVFTDDTEAIPITEAALCEAARPRIRVHPRRARPHADGWDDKVNGLLANWTSPVVTAREQLRLDLDATNRLLSRAALMLDD